MGRQSRRIFRSSCLALRGIVIVEERKRLPGGESVANGPEGVRRLLVFPGEKLPHLLQLPVVDNGARYLGDVLIVVAGARSPDDAPDGSRDRVDQHRAAGTEREIGSFFRFFRTLRIDLLL